MAQYTITLRDLIKSGYKIFDDSWTTFDPEHKQELCEKIIRHYWFHEIGQETPDRFKHYLNEHLQMMMSYYNQLYASELLEIEPLYNYFIGEDAGSDKKRRQKRSMTQREDMNRMREMAESIKRLTAGTSNLVGNQNTVGTETWREDRTIDTSEVTDQDTTEDTTKDVNFSETKTFNESQDSSENQAFEEKEVMADKTTVQKTTDTTSHTTTSDTKRYSDTPQGRIGSSDLTLEAQYLTNYTRNNGTSDTTSNSQENATGTDDRTTDTTSTRETTSDKTTQSTTETSSDEGTKQNVTGTNDVTKTIHTTDNVTGSRNTTSTTDQTEDVKTTGTEHGFSNGSENDREFKSAVEMEDTDDSEGTTIKRNTKGYTISQAELLTAYRNTFINVDQMIIVELAQDFMGIF